MSKTIVITGSSTGLGRATALLFASKGWKVFATLRDPSKEAELAATPGVTVVKLDVTDPAQITEAAKAILAEGPVDVLFNNAGYGLAGPFEGTSDEQLRRQLDTNLLGVMRVTQAFLSAMRERGSGQIVTTTSIGGLVTFPFNSVYHATKWGLEGWSESLAFELEPFGVKVKTVAPGGISSDFAGRSIVRTDHPAYADLAGKVAAAFMSPERRSQGSTPEKIAAEVWEIVADETGRVSHVAGDDARANYKRRLDVGVDAFRAGVRQMFFGA